MDNSRAAASTPPMPPMPPRPPDGTVDVTITVDQHMLWIGDAAYPVHNITRVHTFELKPDRKAACMSFLGWVAVGAFGCLFALGSGSAPTGVLVVGAIVLFGLVADLVRKLNTPSEHVLAIETASASTALVTLPQRERIRGLRNALVEAIKNPVTEMTFHAQSVNINPKKYQYGDHVNMYGGQNNKGIAT
ncbi:DUF6232 family protein [Streptomyces cavernicola]|uniref:DUF6232 family protein n=1 Tax=Streptomyces cavernicola TaxID=3043613 RepID=A0ABT6S2Q3_9ACTN|nr:DUF6232 family protein [Streptomyces sp. B-S-A6]MDI3402352.1 DUF6232 family protein [Streptomyces sp. B-S-A6]